MLIKKANPKELALALLNRSECAVQVAAVIADSKGRIVSYGWNSVGFDGYGIHAEHHALLRANRKRLRQATMYVAGRRKRSGNTVCSKPCIQCQTIIKKVGKVIFLDKDDIWKTMTRNAHIL